MSSIIKRTVASKLKSTIMYFATLVLVLGGVSYATPKFFGQVAHAAGTWSVDATFLDGKCETTNFQCKTIQAAVDAASAGDTINVVAGPYAEHITIDKSISLIGADKTTTIIDGGSTGVVVTIVADNVTLSGFTIRHSGINPLTDAGIGLNGANNCTVNDNIVTNNVTGIAVMSSTGNTINSNTISSSLMYGIVLEAGVPGSYSTGNIISENIINANGRDGIYVGQDNNGNQILNNEITGTVGDSNYGSPEGNGIYFWKSASNVITGNTITNNVAFGIEMYGSSSNTITGNTITGNNDGFHIRNIDEATGYSIRYNNISRNKIYGNTRVNLYASPNFEFNIENNWWGSSDLATVESKLASWDISGDVVLGTIVFLNYTPYYVDSGLTTLSDDTTHPTATVAHNESAKTITYTFSEPVQLRAADDITVLDSGTYATSLAVYDSVTYLAHRQFDPEPAHVAGVTITSAVISTDGKTMTITYTGSLIKNVDSSYIVDAWGKNITDLVGNKMAQSESQIFMVDAQVVVTFTYVAGAGGTIDGAGSKNQPLYYGSNTTAVTAVAYAGYHFTGWSDGFTSATRSDSNVVANGSVTANFAADVVTLATNTVIGGEVLGDTNTVPTTDTIKAPATKGEVKGTSDSKKEDTPWYDAAFMGLAWYWWVVLAIAAGGLGWWAFGAIRNRNQN